MSDAQTTIEIAGQTFQLTDTYAEGYSLSGAEAHALNQLRRENMRNNYRKKVKDALEKGQDPQLLQDDFTRYAAEYSFNGQRVARGTRDPIEAEARKMARPIILAHLKTSNIDVKTLEEGQLDKLIADYAQRPKVREVAEKRLNALKDIADQAIQTATAAS